MKKLLIIISVASMGLVISCGPSAEEQARIEQARQDSITQAMEQARQDSMLQAMEQARQDSLTLAQAQRDSAIADSLAAQMNKPKPKPKAKTPEQKQIEETKKATQGRG